MEETTPTDKEVADNLAKATTPEPAQPNIKVNTEAAGVPPEQPLMKKREPLVVPYEAKVFRGAVGVIHGAYPIDGTTPRFYGEAVARAKPSGPFEEVELPFRFEILAATTIGEAFEQFESVLATHAPAAKQAAAKEWHRLYGGRMGNMQQQGILDAMGMPIRRK